MNQNPQHLVRERRKQLGYSETDVAKKVGITVDQYCDLEEERDEYFMVVPIGDLVALCRLLKLDINELFGLAACDEQQLREQQITSRRKEKGLSVAELAGRVGISEETIVALERDPSSIANWVMDPIKQLAKELEIPISCLVKAAQSAR